MQSESRIRLIGEVCTDVMPTQPDKELRVRLGGVMHAARTLGAIGAMYDLFYIAPNHLTKQIEKCARACGAQFATKIGTILGAPSVMLIASPSEAGCQGYDLLLRDQIEYIYDEDALATVSGGETVTDIALFPAAYNLEQVLRICGTSEASVHIDAARGVCDVDQLAGLGRVFDTVMVSTSSDLFLDKYGASVHALRDSLLGQYCNSFLFKENRGGVRFFVKSNPGVPVQTGAQIRSIVHSVGVGDCFDVAFVALRHKHPDAVALAYASWIAAEYASTTHIERFKRGCERVFTIPPDEIAEMEGVSLPWEDRQSCNIYIAAPDFGFADRTRINYIADCLHYHNFAPRLPVRENGQIEADATLERRQRLCDADIQLLAECQMLLAVLIDNDPGTLIEIGLAAGLGMPVVVYDPYGIAENLMLTQLPSLVSPNPDEVVAKVFELMAREKK